MNSDPNILKSLTESYESLKSHLPSSYNAQQESTDEYASQGFVAQSPEPEQLDYQGNFAQQDEPKQYFNQNRGMNNYRGAQQSMSGNYSNGRAGIGSTQMQRRSYENQKPYFKQQSENNNPNAGIGSSRFQRGGYDSNGAMVYSGGFQRRNNYANNNFGGDSNAGQDGAQAGSAPHYGNGGAGGGYHIAGTKVFVNNIEPHIGEEDIQHFFGTYGKINDLKVFHRADQNYAYVIYDKYEDAFSASNDPSPNPSWNVSLAKSKNTVMQFQQSSMFGNGNVSSSGTSASQQFRGNSRNYGNNEQGDQNGYRKGRFGGFQKQNEQYQQFNQLQAQASQGSLDEFQIGPDGEKFPADSHLTNILNNCRNTNQLVDLMMMPSDRMESLAANKTQINQTILVREIWISSIDESCSAIIREVIEDNFGPVEEIEFFGKKEQSFAFVKFFMVKTAFDAFSNKDRIAELLETDQVKLTYSDPSRRRNIIGDHKEYMKDENLSPVLYVSFPFGFKVSKQVILKIASDYGTVLNATVKRSDDPKQTSSVLIEFKDLKDTKFAYENMREDQERMNPKCEYAILLNSDKFIKENNLKLKDKTKDANNAPNNMNQMGRNPNMPNLHQNNYQQNYFNNRRNNNNNMNMQQGRQNGFRGNNNLDNESYLMGKRKLDSLVNAQEELVYMNETATPEAEPHEVLGMEEDDDDDNFIWSGFISVLSKGRCGMDAKLIHTSGQFELDNHNLNMTTKTPVHEALRHTPYAVLILKPSSETSMKPFSDVKAFLNTSPREAGVINTRSFTIFLLPNCEEAMEICPTLKEQNILALCLSKDMNMHKNKREQKIDDKGAIKMRYQGEQQSQMKEQTKAFAAISSIAASKQSPAPSSANISMNSGIAAATQSPVATVSTPTRGTTAPMTTPPTATTQATITSASGSKQMQQQQHEQHEEQEHEQEDLQEGGELELEHLQGQQEEQQEIEPEEHMMPINTSVEQGVEQEEEEEEEEDMYDPNQVSTPNHQADLSDLIDNPNLVDDMLKSLD